MICVVLSWKHAVLADESVFDSSDRRGVVGESQVLEILRVNGQDEGYALGKVRNGMDKQVIR
jgi:hypothetical protein